LCVAEREIVLLPSDKKVTQKMGVLYGVFCVVGMRICRI
jgi:tetrahydromethanopterin S-methyltransferase subunit G